MTGRTRAELEARLANHLKEQIDHLAGAVDTREQQARLERRLRPIRRRRRPLYLSAVAVATAAAAATVAVLVGSPGESRDATGPASEPVRSTFTSHISPLTGLRFTWPTRGWRAADYQSQIVIRPPGVPGALLRVTKGLHPVDPSGAFMTMKTSAVAVIAALRHMPALKASRPVREYIGDGLAAIHVDIRLSSSAPPSGFDYLVYKGNSVNAAAYRIKKGMLVRVYVAVYRAPYGNELLNIAVEAPTAKEFAQSTTLAERALQALRLPKGLVAGRTFHV